MTAADPLVFRSIYVDHDLDAAVRARAAAERLSNGEMLRRCLRQGLGRHRQQPSESAPRDRLLARSVFLPLELDKALKARAYDIRVRENELVRQLLRAALSE